MLQLLLARGTFKMVHIFIYSPDVGCQATHTTGGASSRTGKTFVASLLDFGVLLLVKCAPKRMKVTTERRGLPLWVSSILVTTQPL